MIEFEINGTRYTDFLTAEVTTSLASLANDFSFTASAVGGFPPFKQGDVISAIVDDTKVMTGFIDEINGIETDGEYKITYSGRDKTGDLIDSSLDIIDDIRGEGITLKKLVQKIIDHLGVDISVSDNFNPESFNLAEDYISPQPGDSAIRFLYWYAMKRQALLSTDPEGNIVITQSTPVDTGEALQSIKGGDSNNIASQSWAIDTTRVYNRYVHRGQLDLRALNYSGETDIAAVVDQGAEVTFSGARTGRQRVIVEPVGYSAGQLIDRALWARQVSIADAFRLQCAVMGHSMPRGGIWADNSLVQVKSDAATVDDKMLIETVTFMQGSNQPTVTVLELVDKKAYTTDQGLIDKVDIGTLLNAYTPAS